VVPEVPVPTAGESVEVTSESATSTFLQLSNKIDSAESKNEDYRPSLQDA